MPLYVFKCVCGREYEELCSVGEQVKACPDCGQTAKREVATPFGISTKIDSRTETVVSPKEIDKVVGEAAAKRWEGYDRRWDRIYKKRREERRAGRPVSEVTIKPDSNGKVSPFEHLGNKREQEFRRDYGKQYKKQITDKGKSPDTPVIMKNRPK
jgi:putative FmdB family regulatory protein